MSWQAPDKGLGASRERAIVGTVYGCLAVALLIALAALL